MLYIDEVSEVTFARDVVHLTMDYIDFRFSDIPIQDFAPVFSSPFAMSAKEREYCGAVVRIQGNAVL